MTLSQWAAFMKGRPAQGVEGGMPGLLKRRANQLLRKVVLDVYRGVLKRWPVDTGRSRANWLLSVGSPLRRTVEPLSPGKPGARERRRTPASQSEVNSALLAMSSLKPDDVSSTVWLVNNLAYAALLEGGSSAQAPEGAVRLTIASVLGKLRPLRVEF